MTVKEDDTITNSSEGSLIIQQNVQGTLRIVRYIFTTRTY